MRKKQESINKSLKDDLTPLGPCVNAMVFCEVEVRHTYTTTPHVCTLRMRSHVGKNQATWSIFIKAIFRKQEQLFYKFLNWGRT